MSKPLLVGAILIAATATTYRHLSKTLPVPKLDEPWWGSGESKEDNTAIKPMKINVPDEVLIDLKNRLNNHRQFVPALENSDHHYGLNTKLLTEIVDFWKNKYDWRSREKYLNKYPQFTTQIQGLDIHFLHVKPSNTKGFKVLPMIMLHGFGSSIREFYEIIPMLTTPQEGYDFVFEVVVPSLPGYGFSQGAVKKGLGAAQVAVIFKNLMQRLGYEKYYLHGGDWGAVIVANMASLFEDKVVGLHSTMCYSNSPITAIKLLIGSLAPSYFVEPEFVDRKYPISEWFSRIMLETGYMHIQSTKPDTIGVVINESPVALAAYLFEKYITFTNPTWKSRADGGLKDGLKNKYQLEDILDNIMIYWVTNSMTTSMRLYAESFAPEQRKLGLDRVAINVPSACCKFKYELFTQPNWFLQDRFKNLVHTMSYDDGGHFAAFEIPRVVADDIYMAVNKIEKLEKEKKKNNHHCK